MKKNRIKTSYKLKIFNDGSTFFTWVQPWRGWIPFTNKDITLHPLWNLSIKDKQTQRKTTYLEKYTKKIKNSK